MEALQYHWSSPLAGQSSAYSHVHIVRIRALSNWLCIHLHQYFFLRPYRYLWRLRNGSCWADIHPSR